MTTLPRSTTLQRDLDAGELRELVSRIAADPGQWRPLVRSDTPERHFEQLWRDDHVDVWVITWASGNDTGFHDHDVSHGAVAVVQGELIEERLVVGGPPRQLRRRSRRDVRLRRVPRPSDAPGRRGARRVDPRLLAAAVAHGGLRGRRRRHAAPPLDLQRRGAAPVETAA